MGVFLAVSAFRRVDPAVLADALVTVAEGFGSSAEVVPAGPAEEDSAAVFAPAGDWTVVVWPDRFNLHDVDTCVALTAALGTTVSTVHVYDDDYWTHAVVADGTVLDLFCSVPDYFDDDPVLAVRYAGRPDLVGEALGVDPALVGRYLQPAEKAGGAQARPGDEFTLDDFWVFTDFWRRMGISYPSDLGAPAVLVDLGDSWSQMFPSGASEL